MPDYDIKSVQSPSTGGWQREKEIPSDFLFQPICRLPHILRRRLGCRFRMTPTIHVEFLVSRAKLFPNTNSSFVCLTPQRI